MAGKCVAGSSTVYRGAVMRKREQPWRERRERAREREQERARESKRAQESKSEQERRAVDRAIQLERVGGARLGK
jgi:hypothetical protein